MSETIIYAITVLLGIIAIVSIILGLRSMGRSKELRKAKLFLKFDLVDRAAFLIGVTVILLATFQLTYVTLFDFGRDGVSLKMPYAIYAPIVYIMIAFTFMTIFSIYKDAGKK